MSDRILVVEDEARVARLVGEILRAVGYEVMAVANGKLALDRLAIEQPDLILLDLMLPGNLDGYEVCRRIREFSQTPIIMLTARAQENDLLRGFEAGADDYLTKPFSAKELVARVKAVLRRSQRPEETSTATWTCGDLTINFAQHGVQVAGQPVALTRTEYALLRELALHANRVMTHQDLLARVWGPEYRDDVDYLRAYVRYLRRKLEADPAQPRFIVTLAGTGYMLACPAEGDPV